MTLTFPQLLLLAVAALTGLATVRLVRVHLGRMPLPEVRGMRLIVLAALLAPPIALGAFSSLPVYLALLAALVILMWVAAVVVQLVARGRIRPLLLVALVGSEGDPEDVPYDPPVTAKLAESVALVDRAKANRRRPPHRPGRCLRRPCHRRRRSEPARHTPPPRNRPRSGLGDLTRAGAHRAG